MVRLCPLQVEREIRSLQTEKRYKAGRPALRPAAGTEGRLLHKHGVLHGPYLRAARHMEMAKVRTRRRISMPDHLGKQIGDPSKRHLLRQQGCDRRF